MIQIHRRQALCSLMALMAGFRPQAAGAQAIYPTRPIRVIVPFAAGGVGDTVIRVLAPTIEKSSDRSLSSNRNRAPPAISGRRKSRAPRPTAIRCSSRLRAISSSIQFLMKMSFDPLTALPPIAKVADIPLIFCSNPLVPVGDLPGFVQYARAHRGELNYGSPGNGSNNHLLVEKLKQRTGIEMTHVPYRSAPQAAMATLTNEVQFFPMGFAVVGGHLQARQADCARRHHKRTVADAARRAHRGRSGFSRSRQFELVGDRSSKRHAGTDPRSLNDAIVEALGSPAVAEHYARLGVRVPTQTREQFVASLRPEAEGVG